MRKKIPIISMILVGMHTTNKPASEKKTSFLDKLASCIGYVPSPPPYQRPNRLPPIPLFSLSSSNSSSGTPTPLARREPPEGPQPQFFTFSKEHQELYEAGIKICFQSRRRQD